MNVSDFLASFKEPAKIAGGIINGVSKAAQGAAEIKAKFDLINTDTDHNGFTQAQDIKNSVVKLHDRAVGPTAVLIKRTKEDWTAEISFYDTELKVLGSFVGGLFGELLAQHTAPAAVSENGAV